ncbi:MAG: hypothetical protein ACE5HI_13635 [bacterium]
MAHILHGIGRLLKDRSRCKFYWLHLVWVLILILYYLIVWMIIYSAGQEASSYPFQRFCLHFLFLASMFILSLLLFPDFPTDGSVDLRRHYFDTHRSFFGVWVVVFVSFGLDLLIWWGGLTLLSIELLPIYIFIVLSVTGASVRNERFHALLTAFFMANILLFMVV